MKKLLIFYNFFKPAKNAGGIVRSLDNLIGLLSKDYKIFIFTSAYDLRVVQPLQDVVHNQWISYSKNVEVYYAADRWSLFLTIKREITRISPDISYINGIFSPGFVLLPLFSFKLLRKSTMLVVAPRGMLQEGALQGKWFKKAVYLWLFKALGLHKGVRWHATDSQEFNDIQSQFGLRSNVVLAILALDTPSIKIPTVKMLPKSKGTTIKLIYLSLIAQKKNLLFLLQVLQQVSHIKIQLDVYGPVKDVEYWLLCQQEAKKLPNNVIFSYCGLADPDQVIETIQKYHFFILPTHGENFGHAIYEALLAGRPVMISDKTPWKDMEAKKGGWIFSLQGSEIKQVIENAANMDEETYFEYCKGAQIVAQQYLADNDFHQQYIKLFS